MTGVWGIPSATEATKGHEGVSGEATNGATREWDITIQLKLSE